MTITNLHVLDQQTRDYLRDLKLTLSGEKPAVIIEHRKSPIAYATGARSLRTGVPGLRWMYTRLADSSGAYHPAMIIGRVETVENIDRLLSTRATMDRKTFQIAMGVQLGYDYADCVAYSESPLGQSCGCECCGGPTKASRLDDERRRQRLSDLYR